MRGGGGGQRAAAPRRRRVTFPFTACQRSRDQVKKEGAPVTGITRWSLQRKRLVAGFWLVLALPSAPRDRHRR